MPPSEELGRVTRTSARRAADESGENNGQLDPLKLLQAIYRRKWLVTAITLLGSAAALMFATSQRPTYTANAELMVRAQANKVVDVQTVVAELTGDETSVQTQMRLLQSTSHVYDVMASLDLFNDPEFLNPEDDEGESDGPLGWAFAWLPKVKAIIAEAPLAPVADASSDQTSTDPWPEQASAIDVFKKKLSVSQAGTSRIVNISFTSYDPQKAAEIAGKTVEIFVEESKEQKLVTTNDASAWIDQRVAALRQDLQAKEQEIERYRTQNNIFSRAGETNLEANELVGFNSQLINVRTEISNLETTLNLIADKRSELQDLQSVPEIAASPTILDLQAQKREFDRQRGELAATYGPRHPRMIDMSNEIEGIDRRIDKEIDRIVQTVTNRRQLLNERRAALEQEIAQIRGKQREQDVVSIRLRDMQLEADSTRRLYETFLQRLKETREQAGLIQPDVTVVSLPNKPSTPSSASPSLIMVIGFCSSFLTGSLLAIFLDKADKRLLYRTQVRRVLDFEAVSLVPKVEGLETAEHPYEYMLEKPLSAYAEAIRGLLLGLRRPGREEAARARVILATSSLPDEGKTSLVTSLAVLAAKFGKRALLIDFDNRNPSVGRQLNIASEVGIVECINGLAELNAAIHRSNPTKLDVLPVAQRSTEAISMYDVDQLGRILRDLETSYDLIFVDCPPILGLIETQMVAEVADDAIFVARWKDTDEMTAKEGFDQLVKSGVNVVGVALNLVDMAYQTKHSGGHAERHYKKFEKYYVN